MTDIVERLDAEMTERQFAEGQVRLYGLLEECKTEIERLRARWSETRATNMAMDAELARLRRDLDDAYKTIRAFVRGDDNG